MELSKDILEKAQYWASSEDFDIETRNEVSDLIESKNISQLTDRFYKDLSFGTGGIRGIMGAGSCRMNVYNIRKASTALSIYLKKIHHNGSIRIAIAYDSRNYSKEFAKSAAEIFTANGINVFFYSQMRPVPMLSFAVRELKCHAGVCVTASHNPPEYNGFKVYWSTGGQLTPPHDQNIIEAYQHIKSYNDFNILPFDKACSTGKIEFINEDFDQRYFNKISSLSVLDKSEKFPLKIVYSPIHGTGIFAVPQALKKAGFNDINIPPLQKDPNGDFPTVSSPNPEDPKALKQSIELAKKINAELILATDPDSDRIACLVKEAGNFKSFNGHQLCCLLTDFLLHSLKEKNRLPKNPLVVSTVVTTKLHKEIANYYGAHCDTTLTGFKWICELIEKYESGLTQPYREYVCGGEESYGFLAGHFVRDKDAVSACVLAAEMVSYYKSKNQSLSDVLDKIFLRHKVYAETLHNLVLPGKNGADKIAALMEKFRITPPKKLNGMSLIRITDLLNGEISELIEGKWSLVEKSALPSSNVLQFEYDDFSIVSVRPSGTEPKIKFYFSAATSTKNASLNDLQTLKKATAERVETFQNNFLSLCEEQQ